MLRDCYVIPEEESRYDDSAIEVHDELTEILQQIDLLLFTKPGDVLGMPRFGCDLEGILFSTTYNEAYVANTVQEQIQNFLYLDGKFDVRTDAKFVTWDTNVAMILDVTVKDVSTGKSLSTKYTV